MDRPGGRAFELVSSVESRYWTTAFFLVVLAYTLVLVSVAVGYSGPARLFPIVVGVPVIVMTVVKIATLLFEDRFQFGAVDLFESAADLDVAGDDETVEDAVRYRGEFVMVLWCVAVLVVAWLFGHLAALAVFVFSFIYYYERSLLRATVATAATLAFVFLLFIQILGSNLWEGVVGLPGPLLVWGWLP